MSSPRRRLVHLFALGLLVAGAWVLPAGRFSSAARPLKVVPRIALSRAVYDGTKTIYVELSITDGTQVYSTMGSIAPGAPKSITLSLVGVPPYRNYIAVARAATNKVFTENLTVLKALIRKDAISAPGGEYTVNINLASTAVAEAVATFTGNTAMDLNDAGIEPSLDAIAAAADPMAEAVRLSTTDVSGTVTDVRGVGLAGMTVAVEGSNPEKKAVTDASGRFTLATVPIRFTALTVEHRVSPRRYLPGSATLDLQAEVPFDVGPVSLEPDPQVIPNDIGTTVQFMIDNSSGSLTGWLNDGFQYIAPGTTMDKAAFIAFIDPRPFHSIDYGSNFVRDLSAGPDYDYGFTCTWIARDAVTGQRKQYDAVGRVQYHFPGWKLSNLTLSNEVALPLPPASVTATGGDHRADVSWIATSDPGVSGYNVYRSTDSDGAGAILLNSGGLIGRAATTYADTTCGQGTYYYWVECVETVEDFAQIKSTRQGTTGPVEVYDSLAIVESFMAAARQRQTAVMDGLLDPGFTALPVGEINPIDKTQFIDRLVGTVFAGEDSAQPAKAWMVLQPSLVQRSAVTGGSELRVTGAYLVGQPSSIETGKNRRWSEDEKWTVSSSSPHRIIRFESSSRTYYPKQPPNFRCTNAGTIESDGQVNLMWDAPADPDPVQSQPAGYYVLRSDTPDWANAVQIADDTPTDTLASDPGIVSGNTYYYWVIAYDSYDQDTKVPGNLGNYIMVGLPQGVRDVAQAFIEASKREVGADIRAVVTADDPSTPDKNEECQIYRESQQIPIADYCAFTNFSLSGGIHPSSFLHETDEYRVSYEIVCIWASKTYTYLELRVVRGTDGQWRIAEVLFSVNWEG